MSITAFPERVKAQKLVSELAEGLGGALNHASARAILGLKLGGPSLEQRRQLAAKANEGLLSPEDTQSTQTYAQLRGLLYLQSKARLHLNQPTSG